MRQTACIIDGLVKRLGSIRIIAIADDERELESAGSFLGRHHLCGFRGVQIQRCICANRQQCHADKTASNGRQVANSVELCHFHFTPH